MCQSEIAQCTEGWFGVQCWMFDVQRWMFAACHVDSSRRSFSEDRKFYAEVVAAGG
jgi:hypothetical protein